MTQAPMWEYRELMVSTILSTADLELQLNALGSLGWEAFAAAAFDPTLGLNQRTVLLRRSIAPWPAPTPVDPAWHPDPTGRHQTRYWDGAHWTQHVVDHTGTQETDYPNRR